MGREEGHVGPGERKKAPIGEFRTNQPCGRSGTSGFRLASLAYSPPPVPSDQGRRKVRREPAAVNP